METHKMTAEEMTQSLTGFDEIAVAKHFGKEDFQDLPGSMAGRALVFVAMRRDGDTDAEAYDKAMGLSLKACGTYFAEPDPDPDQESPTSAEGKDFGPSD